MTSTPMQSAEQAIRSSEVPEGIGDRVAGYGVMGVPFASGDYLALRHWPASSFGPAYRSVWHRDPAGDWTIYADVAPELSCARFIGSAMSRTCTTRLDIEWADDHRFTVRAGDDLEWTVELASSFTTRILGAVAGAMPNWMWTTDLPLRWMGTVTAPMLGVGRLRLAGTVPNGHHFQVAPRKMWLVRHSDAVVRKRPLGGQRRLDPQARLADFWLPQRGIFYAATTASFAVPDRSPEPLRGRSAC